jgi:WD40 repeat protein
MNCFSRAELQHYLREELPKEIEPRVVEHLDTCLHCRQTLSNLSDDRMVRDHLEAMRREELEPLTLATAEEELSDAGNPNWLDGVGDEAPLPLRFDRFLLKQVLGAGGFGTVYLADDLDLQREVAVKIPHLGGLSPEIRRRFMREGMAAASLRHPHLVPVLQAGEQSGICFLVSEYIPGETLSRHLAEQNRKYTAEEAARIVLPLAEAVEHAHQNHVVHRDIKPSNILLDDRRRGAGSPLWPMLTDFGTARLVGPDHSATASGMLIGTVPYMAPEQLSGGNAGPACDIYALGVVLFELLAGRPPFQGSDNADTIRQAISREPPELRRLTAGVPRDLAAICGRCLEKDPRRRYGSAVDLADDLRRFLRNEPTAARPLGPAARMVRWSRRNPLPLSIMGMICLVFVIIFAGFAWHSSRLREFNNRLTAWNRRALELKERAEQSELHAQQLRYASDIRLAAKLWREGDLKNVWDILDRQLPGAGNPDLRGIEWHFLRRAIQPQGATLAAVGSPLYCLRVAPDHERFATGGQDGTIRLHDRKTGVIQRTISSGQGEVNSVAFSPDGQVLASAGDDGSVRLWRVSDGKQIARLAAHEGLAFGCEFTPDSEYLVTCGTDGLVNLWRDGNKEVSYQDHTSRVEAIAISPNGRWLASVGKDRTLVVRDMHTGELNFKWKEGHGTLSSVVFSPDSSTLAISEGSGDTKWMRLFDLVSSKQIMAREHADGIRRVAIAPDGLRILTADDAGTVRIWSLSNNIPTDRSFPSERDSKKPLAIWRAHESRIHCGSFEPEGTSVLTVGEDGQVCRWNIPGLANEESFDKTHCARATGFVEESFLFHDITSTGAGRDFVAAANVGIATLRSGSHDAFQFQRRSEHYALERVAMPPGASWIVVGGSTPQEAVQDELLVPAVVERWDTEQGSVRTLLRTRSAGAIHHLCCSPNGALVSVVLNERVLEHDGSKRLLLLDSESGAIQREFPAGAGTKACFSRDGRLLIFGVQRDLHLVDLQTDQQRTIKDAHTASQTELAISNDGKWLATCDEGRNMAIWNLRTLERHTTLRGHQGRITGLAFAVDSRTLLSCAYDGTVKAWSVLAGLQLMDLQLATEGVSGMAISADGSRLAVIDNKARITSYVIDRTEHELRAETRAGK